MQKPTSQNTFKKPEFTNLSIGIPTNDGCVMIDWARPQRTGPNFDERMVRLYFENGFEFELTADEARTVAEALLDFTDLSEALPHID